MSSYWSRVDYIFQSSPGSHRSSMYWGSTIGAQPYASSYVWENKGKYSGSWGPNAFLNGVLLANIPQLGLSTIYLCCNGVFSNLFKIREWNNFGTCRQGLRVTSPEPGSAQRPTYFLAFPLRYSLPFLTYLAVTHWFVSQTLFFTRIYSIYSGGQKLISSLGFSPIGLLCTTVAISALLLLYIGSLFYAPKLHAPAACGESIIISAACHPPAGEKDPHLKPVQWGVTNIREDGAAECSFSSEPVQLLTEGQDCVVRYRDVAEEATSRNLTGLPQKQFGSYNR